MSNNIRIHSVFRGLACFCSPCSPSYCHLNLWPSRAGSAFDNGPSLLSSCLCVSHTAPLLDASFHITISLHLSPLSPQPTATAPRYFSREVPTPEQVQKASWGCPPAHSPSLTSLPPAGLNLAQLHTRVLPSSHHIFLWSAPSSVQLTSASPPPASSLPAPPVCRAQRFLFTGL